MNSRIVLPFIVLGLASCESLPTQLAAATQCLEAAQLLEDMPVRTYAADAAADTVEHYCTPPREDMTPAETQELVGAVAVLRGEVARTGGKP